MATVARADQQPGRRRATPAPKRGVPLPSLPKIALPPRQQRTRVWFLVTGLGLLLCVLGWTGLDVPGWMPPSGAVLISTTFAMALAARTGGWPNTSGLVALVIAVTAVATEEPILLSGAAVGTAVLAAILGVMVTMPAARFGQVAREVTIAAGIAAVGAFAVEAYQAPVSVDRASYLALAAALLGAVGLVYRLGAGIHGLGRRGGFAVVSGIGLLFVGLAYSEALSRWGTGELTNSVGDAITNIHDAIGAVPRPTEFLLGFPALAWGISTRARRRQGWWVCAFGAAGLSVVSTSLLNPAVPLVEAGLVLLYSLVLGLGLGYAAIRADAYLTGTRGRRARRLEEEAAHRPEPARTEALL
ncbi:MAG TPA: hypothetical protein VLI04_03355 [Nocardioidaceae bacterium]|nr:hypothetical protein [Nocardioidaceae bacterium]